MHKLVITVLAAAALFIGSLPNGIYAQGVLTGVFRGAARGAGARASGGAVIRAETRVAATRASVRSSGTWTPQAYGSSSYSSITWGDGAAAHGQGSFAKAQIGVVSLTVRGEKVGALGGVIRRGRLVTNVSSLNSARLASPWMSKDYFRSIIRPRTRLIAPTAARTRGTLAKANIGSSGTTISSRTTGTINIARASAVAGERTPWWKPRFAGRGSTANAAKSTFQPRNLREKLAIEQVKSNPDGIRVKKVPMTDTRWPAYKGWVKMEQIVKPGGKRIIVHYVRNILTGEFDDFKIVDKGQPHR